MTIAAVMFCGFVMIMWGLLTSEQQLVSSFADYEASHETVQAVYGDSEYWDYLTINGETDNSLKYSLAQVKKEVLNLDSNVEVVLDGNTLYPTETEETESEETSNEEDKTEMLEMFEAEYYTRYIWCDDTGKVVKIAYTSVS